MRASHGALAAITLLGLGLGLATISVLRRNDGSPPVDRVLDDARTSSPDVTATTPSPQAAPAQTPVRERGAVATQAAGTSSSASAASADDDAETVCAQILANAADFAMMEALAAYPVPAEGPRTDLLGELERNTAGLRDPDDFVAAVLLDRPETRVASDPSAHTALVDLGALAADSDSPLLAWHALRACVEAGQFCPFTHLEQRLLEVQRDNAEAWALVATLEYRRGDVAAALAAMQDAARAPTSTWYWAESIATFERSLAARTTASYPERLNAAFGAAAAAGLPSQSDFVAMCRTESARSRAWGEACLAFGTLRGETNETVMARALAYGIRADALKALGETERAEELAAERAVFRAALARLGSGGLQEGMLATDAARLHAYLAAVQEHGESAGMRAFLREFLPPLLERAGLLERDATRECVAPLLE